MEDGEEERMYVGSMLWIMAAFQWNIQEIYSYFKTDKWKRKVEKVLDKSCEKNTFDNTVLH